MELDVWLIAMGKWNFSNTEGIDSWAEPYATLVSIRRIFFVGLKMHSLKIFYSEVISDTFPLRRETIWVPVMKSEVILTWCWKNAFDELGQRPYHFTLITCSDHLCQPAKNKKTDATWESESDHKEDQGLGGSALHFDFSFWKSEKSLCFWHWAFSCFILAAN